MDTTDFHTRRRMAETPFGNIAYMEQGEGPAALFLHGAFLNGFQWREVLPRLGALRRCIALDLMSHGFSEVSGDQDLSFRAQAEMVSAFLDHLGIDEVDLVGNDSGGCIGQLFAVEHPERLRSLALTNCDVHDNWPPRVFLPIMGLAQRRVLGPVLGDLLEYPELARSDFGLGVGYAHPSKLTEEVIRTYLEPLCQSPERVRRLEDYFLAFDCSQTVAIEPQLRELRVPTLVMWGADDVVFHVEWAHWLKRTIPGVTHVIEVDGGRLFFPEEMPRLVCSTLESFWSSETRA